jgi:hypothetical protein
LLAEWRPKECVATAPTVTLDKHMNVFKRGNRGTARAERYGTRAETRFRLSAKQTGPFKSVGASVQSTAGSRGVRISLSNAGYTTFGGGARVLATHSIRQFPLHFPSRASPCATRFRMSYTFLTACVALWVPSSVQVPFTSRLTHRKARTSEKNL